MLTSLAYILLLGLLLGALAGKLRLPPLIGMIAAGILLGPSCLNLLSPTLLGISADLRQLALIIILTRAGLSLDVATLKRVGRPAVLMCFLPACFEIAGMVVLAPRLLGVSVLDAAIMGAVVGAVSPAVIVPRMLKVTEEGYGTDKGIPQLVLAGASVDDVFVIVMFTMFTGLASGQGASPLTLRTPWRDASPSPACWPSWAWGWASSGSGVRWPSACPPSSPSCGWPPRWPCSCWWAPRWT